MAVPACARPGPRCGITTRFHALPHRHRFQQLRPRAHAPPRFQPPQPVAAGRGVGQYTCRKLAPHEGNIDHVVPRSRGGKTSWDNCVLAHKEINSRKADRLPQEAGMRLLKAPVEPKALPASALIQNAHGVRDWDFFLG
jgi:5-methylcytosine-specific restriction endonuclease McrA